MAGLCACRAWGYMSIHVQGVRYSPKPRTLMGVHQKNTAVSYQKPHLLIMDEPTNNLDLESVEALSEAVAR